jgi:uncharacterized protein
MERVVYNTILGVKEPDSDGDYPYYSTYGERARKVYYPKKWPCCSGTLVQGVADYVKNIYFRAADGVAVNLYAPSTVKWSQGDAGIMLTQETEYPLAQTVTLRIDCTAPAAFALRLRIPGWLQQPAAIKVNGKLASAQMSRGFATLKRQWSSGDTVTLELPQSFRTEAIDDLHMETVAVLRGPLLYVELNPGPGQTRLGQLERRKLLEGNPGIFVERNAGRERIHAPFYFVRDESYTTYFEKS